MDDSTPHKRIWHLLNIFGPFGFVGIARERCTFGACTVKVKVCKGLTSNIDKLCQPRGIKTTLVQWPNTFQM